MKTINLPPGTDVLVELLGLKTQSGGTEQNGATVNMTLYDSAGSQVSGQTWPTPLNAVGTGGDYNGILTDALILVRNSQYTLEVVADAGSNQRRIWKIPCLATWDDDDQ